MAKMKVAEIATPNMQKKSFIKAILKVTLVMVSIIFMSGITIAQPEQGPVQMADGMRSNGKIYVVVAVLLTVLIGLFLYVIRLDRKISKLEKQNL